MVSNIQRYFTLRYYAWFHARNLKFQGNKCTQEEGIWINSNLRLSIIVPKTLGGISISHYLYIMICNKSWNALSIGIYEN